MIGSYFMITASQKSFTDVLWNSVNISNSAIRKYKNLKLRCWGTTVRKSLFSVSKPLCFYRIEIFVCAVKAQFLTCKSIECEPVCFRQLSLALPSAECYILRTHFTMKLWFGVRICSQKYIFLFTHLIMN